MVKRRVCVMCVGGWRAALDVLQRQDYISYIQLVPCAWRCERACLLVMKLEIVLN